MFEVSTEFPGHELVRDGLADLREGRETVAALLLQMAAPRLRALGIDVPHRDAADPPSHRLYSLLSESGYGPHSRYNALVARIVSFARAAEHAATR